MVEKAQDARSEHSISGTSYNPARPSTSASVGLGETGGESSSSGSPSRREIFDATLAGVQDHVLLPHLRSDPSPSKTYHRPAHSLDEFRQQEGEQREGRVKDVWQRLTVARNGKGKDNVVSVRPVSPVSAGSVGRKGTIFTKEEAEKLRDIYDDELLHKCGNSSSLTHTRGPKPLIPWKDFYRYAEAKEVGELSITVPFRWLCLSDRNLI